MPENDRDERAKAFWQSAVEAGSQLRAQAAAQGHQLLSASTGQGGATMASVAAITELEAELSQARNAAEALLAQLAAMIEAEDLNAYDDLPPHLVVWAREISARFHVPLVRVLSLVRQSQMLGSTDADAIRLAV